eukprot:gb/GECG01008206.1/.p1 GENE.gb/GECG01008206.1/~~gb/GECG01008206.1/.p1  ORF type:complete len:128 (+),score=6.84 gb/GECG01008206.1/:1-384(+)
MLWSWRCEGRDGEAFGAISVHIASLITSENKIKVWVASWLVMLSLAPWLVVEAPYSGHCLYTTSYNRFLVKAITSEKSIQTLDVTLNSTPLLPHTWDVQLCYPVIEQLCDLKFSKHSPGGFPRRSIL